MEENTCFFSFQFLGLKHPQPLNTPKPNLAIPELNLKHTFKVQMHLEGKHIIILYQSIYLPLFKNVSIYLWKLLFSIISQVFMLIYKGLVIGTFIQEFVSVFSTKYIRKSRKWVFKQNFKRLFSLYWIWTINGFLGLKKRILYP